MEDDTLQNNILIIGNGFDIGNKYRTRYTDFISFIENRKYEEFSSVIEKEVFKELSNNNSFIRYFTINNKFKLWCDVENEMHLIIKSINKIFNEKDDNRHIEYTGLPDSKKSVSVCEITPYDENVLFMFKLVENYYGHIIIKDDFYDYIYGIRWEEMNIYLTSELVNFKKLLTIYLDKYVPLIKEREHKIVPESTREQLEGIKPEHIITFNYTDFYKEYYKCDSVTHLHGKLSDNNIVLGFNDDEDVDYHFVRFKKYFQRIQNKLILLDDRNESFYEEEAFLSGLMGEKILKNNKLYFYGFSFDNTDEDYIRYLLEKVDYQKAIIYYLDNTDYDRKLVNLINIFGKHTFLKIFQKIEMVKIN